MLRFILPVFAALLALLLLIGVATYYLESAPNQLSYRIHVDAENRLYINSRPANEDQVYDLGADMTIDLSIEYHPRSDIRFCFQERGCI